LHGVMRDLAILDDVDIHQHYDLAVELKKPRLIGPYILGRSRAHGLQVGISIPEPDLADAIEQKLAPGVALRQGVRLYISLQPRQSCDQRRMRILPVFLELADRKVGVTLHQGYNFEHDASVFNHY